MKILHVEAGMTYYGGPQQVASLMQGLHGQGMQNVLACPKGSAIAEACTAYADVHPIAMGGDLDLGLIGRIKKLIEQTRPDLIHLHSRRGADVLGGIAGRMSGAPIILSRRVDNPEHPLVVKLKYKLYDRVITISEGIRQVLLKEGVAPTQLRLVHDGVDVQTYRPDRSQLPWLRQEFKLNDDALVVGMVAQFIARKGHQTLLNAIPAVVAQHPAVQFLLFGQGPDWERIRQQVDASPLLRQHVQLPGFRNDLHRILPCLDILAHPAFMEGLGVSLLQAAACGVPIIGGRAGGIPEVVRHNCNGLLITPGQPAEMQQALMQLLANADQRHRMGLAGREIIEARFSNAAMVQGNAACYRELLGRDLTNPPKQTKVFP